MNAIQQAIQILGGPSATARAIGVSVQLACFWRDGLRNVQAEKCAAIEIATGGRVTRKELRPNDWQAIWPELAAQQPAAEGQGA